MKKLAHFALAALFATTLMPKPAHSGEVVLGAVIGISLSAGITMSVLNNALEGSDMDPYGRSDIYQNAVDVIALEDAGMISEGLAAVIAQVRKDRPHLQQYTDLEIVLGMMELESEQF
jgi:hypothetical protein